MLKENNWLKSFHRRSVRFLSLTCSKMEWFVLILVVSMLIYHRLRAQWFFFFFFCGVM